MPRHRKLNDVSRGVELPWHIFGRRIRPFSFGLLLATLVIGIQSIILPSSPGSAFSQGVMATICFSGVVLLLSGWAWTQDSLHDWGLLVVSGAWMGRSTLYILDDNWERTGLYTGFIFAMMAIGAWFIERYDHRWQHIIAARAAEKAAKNVE